MARSRGRKSKAYEALQTLIRERLDTDAGWQSIANNWPSPSPREHHAHRASVIIICAVLEQALEAAIASHFVISEEESNRLFDDMNDSPLTTFSAKIKIAFALGVLNDALKKDLTTIKNLRNVFAHSKSHVDFNNDGIIASCRDLCIPELAIFHDRMPTDPRDIFMLSVRVLYSYLSDKREMPVRYATSTLLPRMLLKTGE